jgi:hypothetical protein
MNVSSSVLISNYPENSVGSLQDNLKIENQSQQTINTNENQIIQVSSRPETNSRLGLDNFTAQMQKQFLDIKTASQSSDQRTSTNRTEGREESINVNDSPKISTTQNQFSNPVPKTNTLPTPINKEVVNTNVSTIKSKLTEIVFPNNPKPQEIGKIRYQAERDIISTLKNTKSDADLLATLTTLEQKKVLKGLFQSVKNTDNRRELLDYLGSRINTSNVQISKAIENTIAPHIESLSEDAQIHFNLGRFGLVVTKPPVDYTKYKYVIGGDSSAPFTGSGATGVNPTQVSVPIKDQVSLLYENKIGKGVDYKNSKASAEEAPKTAQYANPLTDKNPLEYLSTLSSQERQAQAKLLLSQPISSVFAESYGSQLPTRIDVIKSAAKAYNLSPELIASVLLAEQRDQSKNEDGIDYQSASKAGNDSSIGLGQVTISATNKNKLLDDLILFGNREKLTLKDKAKLLSSDEVNIFATAKYLRQIANEGAKYEIAPNKKLPFASQLDMKAFANNSANWPDDNIKILGSEYTSTPWDGKIHPIWGEFVYQAYKDVKASKVF